MTYSMSIGAISGGSDATPTANGSRATLASLQERAKCLQDQMAAASKDTSPEDATSTAATVSQLAAQLATLQTQIAQKQAQEAHSAARAKSAAQPSRTEEASAVAPASASNNNDGSAGHRISVWA